MTKRIPLHRLRNISRPRPIAVAEERGERRHGPGQVIEWPIGPDDCLEDS